MEIKRYIGGDAEKRFCGIFYPQSAWMKNSLVGNRPDLLTVLSKYDILKRRRHRVCRAGKTGMHKSENRLEDKDRWQT